MIEFNGYISGATEKYFFGKSKKIVLITLLVVWGLLSPGVLMLNTIITQFNIYLLFNIVFFIFSLFTVSTDFSGNLYILDANTRDNTKSASTKALINNSGNSYWVITDSRTYGYVEIINSYKTYNIAKQADILNAFYKYAQCNSVNPSIWYRTISSMYIEWTWHNIAYSFGVMQNSSKSACFDIYPFCNTNNALMQIFGEGQKRGWW